MKNSIFKFLLLLFCVFPAASAFAYEFDVVNVERLPNNGKFPLYYDEVNCTTDNPKCLPLTIVYIKTDIKDLFTKPQDEIMVNKSPYNEGYLLYIDTNVQTLPVIKEGFAPLRLSPLKADNTNKKNSPFETTVNGDSYYYVEIKAKGNDIAKYNGRPVVTFPKAKLNDIFSIKHANNKPSILVTTDLPFNEIEGKIFKKGQASFLKKRDGAYAYVVTYDYASFKEVLQPQISVYKDGKYSTAATDESLNDFIFAPGQTSYVQIIWTTKPIPQHEIKDISKYSQEMKTRKTK